MSLGPAPLYLQHQSQLHCAAKAWDRGSSPPHPLQHHPVTSQQMTGKSALLTHRHSSFQSQLYGAAWAMWRVCFPECLSSEGWGQLCTAPEHLCGHRWLPIPGMYAWTLVLILAMCIHTEPCHCMIVDPYMAPSGSMGWDLGLQHHLWWQDWLFLSNLASAVPSLLILKLLSLVFSAISLPHTYAS